MGLSLKQLTSHGWHSSQYWTNDSEDFPDDKSTIIKRKVIRDRY